MVSAHRLMLLFFKSIIKRKEGRINSCSREQTFCPNANWSHEHKRQVKKLDEEWRNVFTVIYLG